MKSLIASRFALPLVGAVAGVLLAAGAIACVRGWDGPQPRSADAAKAPVASHLSADASAAPITRTAPPRQRAASAPSPREVAEPVAAFTPVPAVTPVPLAAVPYVAPDAVIVAPVGHAPLPAAFQPLPDDAGMTNEQRALLDNIQEQFVQDIGGTNQDPNSPYYLARWREAQRKCDAALKTAFGPTDFIRRQMATVRAEHPAKPGS